MAKDFQRQLFQVAILGVIWIVKNILEYSILGIMLCWWIFQKNFKRVVAAQDSGLL